jgi:hypothetical protein
MFGLAFLSNEKKKILEKLQSRLSLASSPLLRNETQLAIQEIEAQAKPYQQCDLAEADELRTQLLTKMNILANIGKINSIEVFRMHLKDVEFHIATLQMAEKLQEEKRTLQPEEGPNAKDKAPTLNSMKKEKKKKEAFGHQRWTIDFEDTNVDEKNH